MNWSTYTFARYLAVTALVLTPIDTWAFSPRTTHDGDIVRWGEFVSLPTFTVHSPPSNDAANPEALLEVVSQAATTWSQTTTGLDLALQYDEGGPPAIGWNRDAPEDNENSVIVAASDWDYEDDAMAATLLTYSSTTGELLDADIVLNGEKYDFAWLTGDELEGAEHLVDLLSVVMHELGHAIGLDHSEHAEATMFPYLGIGETWMADISDDDREGAIFLYPPLAPSSAKEAATDLAPGDLNVTRKLGCDSAGGEGSGLAILLVLLVAFVRLRGRGMATVLLLSLLTITARVEAQPLEELPAAFQLALERGEVAYLGAVTEVSSRWEGRQIISTVRVETIECLVGGCLPEQQFRFVGGRIDGLVQELSSRKNLKKGQQVLVVVERDPGSTVPPFALLTREVRPGPHGLRCGVSSGGRSGFVGLEAIRLHVSAEIRRSVHR